MNYWDIIEKYYKKNTPLYNIYTSHVQDVTLEATNIAKKHSELNIDLKFIEEASMLHDIGIFKTNAPDIKCFGAFAYICHGYLGSEILLSEGYPQHALVAERHTGIGISIDTIIKNNLKLPHRDFVPISIEEKLICFADKFYSKTNLGKRKSEKSIINNLKTKEDIYTFKSWCEIFL